MKPFVVTKVWARNDIKAKELVIFPDASEIKDRYWTVAKSTICHGAEEIHPQRKSLAIDGRLRGVPEDGKPYSIFFVIERVPEEKEPNLVQCYAEVKMHLKIDIPITATGKVKSETAEPPMPRMPYITNPKKIEAGSKLTVAIDAEIEKLAKAAKAAKIKAFISKITRKRI